MKSAPWASGEGVLKHLGVAKDCVYRWIEGRNLPANKIGRLWKFLEVSADIVEHVAPIFFGDPKSAAMKVLGG